MEKIEIGACVIDSSVWVALFLDGDTNHEKAAALFEVMPRRVYVPYIVLAEVATTLTYKHSKKQADKFLQFVTEDERCTLIESSSRHDVDAYNNCSDKISFADIAIMEAARSFEVALITFDKLMKKVYEREAGK